MSLLVKLQDTLSGWYRELIKVLSETRYLMSQPSINELQWGSEIRPSLDFELHLKSGQMAVNFVKNHLKSGPKVWILNGPFFEWLGLQP